MSSRHSPITIKINRYEKTVAAGAVRYDGGFVVWTIAFSDRQLESLPRAVCHVRSSDNFGMFKPKGFERGRLEHLSGSVQSGGEL